MPDRCSKLKLVLFRCSDISSWPLGTAQDVIRDDELTPTPYNQRVFIPSKSQHGSPRTMEPDSIKLYLHWKGWGDHFLVSSSTIGHGMRIAIFLRRTGPTGKLRLKWAFALSGQRGFSPSDVSTLSLQELKTTPLCPYPSQYKIVDRPNEQVECALIMCKEDSSASPNAQ